jgi:hypothetical protein
MCDVRCAMCDVRCRLGGCRVACREGFFVKIVSVLCRPGSDLLSRVLRRSTIGAGGFNGRVRNGIGFRPPARTTRPAKHSVGSFWFANRSCLGRRHPVGGLSQGHSRPDGAIRSIRHCCRALALSAFVVRIASMRTGHALGGWSRFARVLSDLVAFDLASFGLGRHVF